jgi:hypothetical protein
MKNEECRATVLRLRERPNVWRLVHSSPLDVKTARRAGAIARSLWCYGQGRSPEHLSARSETINGEFARVWAIWRDKPEGWRHKGAAADCSYCLDSTTADDASDTDGGFGGEKVYAWKR